MIFVVLIWTVFVCDHLRDVPWEDISASAAPAASEFCEWVQVGIDVYIIVNIRSNLISMVFSYLYCCQSSQKSLFSFVPTE